MSDMYRGAHALAGLHCRCCGTKILQVQYSGRLPDYCGPECRNVMKYWNAFRREMDKVELSDSKRQEWAGELFRLRNGIN